MCLHSVIPGVSWKGEKLILSCHIMWAMGGDLTAKSISLVGDLIEYLCSGVRTFAFFGRETGTKFQCVYIASSIFFGKGVEFKVKCSTITLKGKFVCIVTFYTTTMM